MGRLAGPSKQTILAISHRWIREWRAASEREIGVSDKTIEECFCRAGPHSVATALARNVPLHRSQWTLPGGVLWSVSVPLCLCFSGLDKALQQCPAT